MDEDLKTIVVGLLFGVFILVLLITPLEWQKMRLERLPALKIEVNGETMVFQARKEIPETLHLEGEKLKIETGPLFVSFVAIGDDLALKYSGEDAYKGTIRCPRHCILGEDQLWKHSSVQINGQNGLVWVAILTAPPQVGLDARRYRDPDVRSKYPFLTDRFIYGHTLPTWQTYGRDILTDSFEYYYMIWRTTGLFDELSGNAVFDSKYDLDMRWDLVNKKFYCVRWCF